jgi:hypothetical protein
MAKQKFKRIVRPATAAEKRRHAAIRAKVMREFPPVEAVCGKAVPQTSKK